MQFPTYLVCGPKGVGKTTAVHKALEGEPGVVHVPLDPCTVDNFYSSILHLVGSKYHDIDKISLVQNALQCIREWKGKKPTDSDNLKDLIVEPKLLGSEYRLANFFLITSTS